VDADEGPSATQTITIHVCYGLYIRVQSGV